MPPADFEDKAAAEDDEVAAMFDLKLKKKKKKKKVETESGESGGADAGGAAEGDAGEAETPVLPSSAGATDLDPPIYTYGQMLNRVVELLHQNNPEMLEKRKYTMKPPQLMRGVLSSVLLFLICSFFSSTHPIPTMPTTRYLYSRHEEDAVDEFPGDLLHDAPQPRSRFPVHDGRVGYRGLH